MKDSAMTAERFGDITGYILCTMFGVLLAWPLATYWLG